MQILSQNSFSDWLEWQTSLNFRQNIQEWADSNSAKDMGAADCLSVSEKEEDDLVAKISLV